MAPWSSNRLLSSSTRNDSHPAAPSSPPVAQPSYAPSRITEADILDSALSIPTLNAVPNEAQRNTGGNPARPTRTVSHGRSISHPFPSLFSSKKKRQDESGGLESTDDDSGSSPIRSQHSGRQSKSPDKDLTTGKCMTCDSMVRWPKNLQVFRCTVCLTINDLKPIRLEARNVDGHRAPVNIRSGTTPTTGESSFPDVVLMLITESTSALD
jgi:E3 ubiquitin-protein ligase HECTD2